MFARLRIPGDIAVGAGAALAIGGGLGNEALVLLVASRHVDPAALGLDSAVHRLAVVRASGEPTIDSIVELRNQIDGIPDVVVAAGGGSVIDAAKALAAFLPNRHSTIIDHLELVGSGRRLEREPLPIVAVPTTAGTGSEMTMNAVLGVPGSRRKVSLRDDRLLPRAVVLDPSLGAGVPLAVRATCALDAAVQLIEAFVAPFATELSDLFARRGAEIGLQAMARTIHGDTADEVRSDMLLAASWSGVALANSKLGAVHGFAGVLGGMVDLRHGTLCGLFVAPVLRATLARLRAETPDHPALARYLALARLADPQAGTAEDLASWFEHQVAVAGLENAELRGLDPVELAGAVQAASSAKGNPVALTVEELADIYISVADG